MTTPSEYAQYPSLRTDIIPAARKPRLTFAHYADISERGHSNIYARCSNVQMSALLTMCGLATHIKIAIHREEPL